MSFSSPVPRSAGLLASLPFLVLMALWAGCKAEPAPPAEPAAAALDTLEYVGRTVCAACHAAEVEQWAGSDHDLAMAEATRESVLGDFENATFTEHGITTRFFREGDRYLVRTEGPTGRMETFEVKYTYGYRPLQQYLVAFPDGRVQALTVAWDTERKRWFSLYPDERIEPDNWLHWTKAGMNWNYMCADCHSTDLKKGYDVLTNTYATTWSEIDVSCEACHGPGERHVAWAKASGREDAAAYEGVGLTVQLSGEAHQRDQIETCAPCHSRRRIIFPDFLPGKSYLDHYEPALLEPELYYPDGQIKDEVYVYGSFLQSKMYHNGVRCSNCHDPHSTRLRFEGNALCTQCHQPEQFDTFAHHRHPEASKGAECVECHMPARTYMQVDPRRDHSFRIPRPDLSVELGTPNACNDCHTEESAAWAAERIVEWFGPERPGEPHFARTFAAAQQRQPDAEAGLRAVAANRDKPAIVRATALFLLDGYATPTAREAARQALQDPEPLVRSVAVRNLEQAAPEELGRLLTPLLQDSARIVRMEAARVLARVAADRFARAPETDDARAFWAALAEYQTGQHALSDQAAAHLNLAVTHEAFGELNKAEEAYQTALRVDSTFVPAHANLAMLYNRRRLQAESAGRRDAAERFYADAERALRQALRLQPDLPDVHYTLGLLLAEQPERFAEAAEHLSEAARLDPENARVHYNAGLANQQLGKALEAERLLLAAHRLEPSHPDYLNALSILYAQQEKWPEALHYTRLLVQRAPGDPALQQRLAMIEGRLRGRLQMQTPR